MLVPEDLKYQKSDEWVKIENDIATIGISDYAQDSLSDIVYLEFAVEKGSSVKIGDNLGTVESVKAASDINIPVNGEVIEINETLVDQPELINSDPYGDGWMIKIKVTEDSEISDLMDSEEYTKYCQER